MTRPCRIPTASGLIYRLSLSVAVTLAAVSLAVSIRDAYRRSGVDVNIKVAAAKTISRGWDPYWNVVAISSDGTVLTPEHADRTYPRLTVPPTVLLVYVPLAELPYKVQRRLWFAAEWASLAGSIVILLRRTRHVQARRLLLVTALLFFVSSYFWRLHAERGQYYVFLLLLLCSGAARFLSSGDRGWSAAILFGIAAALRPSLALIALPLFVLGARRTAIMTCAVAAALVLATLPITGFQAWVSYVQSVSIMERHVFDYYFTAEPIGMPIYTGFPGGYADMAEIAGKGDNTSLLGAFLPHVRAALGWPSQTLSNAVVRMGAVCFVSACGMAWWRSRRRGRVSRRVLMAVSLAFCSALDIFVPIRLHYVDVLYLAPLGLFAEPVFRLGRPLFPAALVALGLVVGSGGTSFVSEPHTVQLRTAGIVAGLTCLAVWFCLARAPRATRHPRQKPADCNQSGSQEQDAGTSTVRSTAEPSTGPV